VKGVEVSKWPQRIDAILSHRFPGSLIAMLVVASIVAIRLLLT
jgi:hypothetical protein